MVAAFVAITGAATASAAQPASKPCVHVKAAFPQTGDFTNQNCEGTASRSSGEWIDVTKNFVALGENQYCYEVETPETGNFNNSTCTEPNPAETGKFVDVYGNPFFRPKGGVFPVAFTSTGGKKLLRTAAGDEVECTATTDAGSITSSRADKVTIKFTGCKLLKPISTACMTAGATNAEEIVTQPLASKIVYLETQAGAAKRVGLALEKEGGGVLAEFECGIAGKVVVTGSVIGEFPPTDAFGKPQYNVMRKEFELAFECEPAGSATQKWRFFEEPAGVLSAEDILLTTTVLKANESSCEEEASNDVITLTGEEGEIVA